MSSDLIPSSSPLTMSSLEISVLVDSRHDKVKQSIDRLVERNVVSKPPMGDGPKSANGIVTQVYMVNKRDSYVVVAQLSPEFTGRLVDRWQELEAQALNPVLPDFTNPIIAARAWADEAEAKQLAQAKVKELEPKAAFHDRVAQTPDLLTVREAAKVLRTGEKRLFRFLREESLLMASNLPYQDYLNRGLFRVVETPYTDNLGRHRVSAKTCITQKGMVYIQGLQDALTLR